MCSLRSGIETHWCWLQFSALLAVVTAMTSRTNAGASQSDSCQGIGTGPVRCGGWLLEHIHFLSFLSFSTQLGLLLRHPVEIMLPGAVKRWRLSSRFPSVLDQLQRGRWNQSSSNTLVSCLLEWPQAYRAVRCSPSPGWCSRPKLVCGDTSLYWSRLETWERVACPKRKPACSF